MKKVVILMALAIAFLAAACTREENKKVLTKEIVYDVLINNNKMICEGGNEIASFMWFMNNIQASERSTFLGYLFEKAMIGKIAMKDNEGKEMTPQQFKERLVVFDSARRYYSSPIYDTLIQSNIQSYDIMTLRFREKWIYDTKTMEISKKVFAYAPLYFPNDPKRPGKRVHEPVPLFWLEQDTLAPCNIQLTSRIVYNVPVQHPPISANSDSANCANYLDDLCNLVFTDSITAYYLWSWDNKDSVVEGKVWKALFGVKDNDEETAKIEKRFGPVDGMRFMEEWYMDPVSMQLSKKVNRLGVVTINFDRRGEFKGYIPTYYIKFGQIAAHPVKKKKAEETAEKEKE
jgi:hypothetical protein